MHSKLRQLLPIVAIFCWSSLLYLFFFFNDTATTEIYTLSLHDALPICRAGRGRRHGRQQDHELGARLDRSEEHTSELQSQSNLVCRLLLEKKNTILYRKATSDRTTLTAY